MRVSEEAAEDPRVLRALVLDHDGDVLEAPGDLLGKHVQRGSNVLLELLWLHQ